MRTIYQIDHGFLGETAEIEPGQPAPAGWTFTPPPKIPRGKAAKWDGEHGSGWTLVPSSEEKAAQQDTRMKTPKKTPRLKGSAFLKPYLPALVMDMMLFGPGVSDETAIYEKKAAKSICRPRILVIFAGAEPQRWCLPE